jgi:trehalose 6-phosphate phosphatase
MRTSLPTPIDLSKVAILLDVDGTLLDIAPTPHEVRVSDELRRTLAQLSERTGKALALVSGRSLADLDRIFAPLQLPAVGGHGIEIRPAADGRAQDGRAAPLDEQLKRRFARIAADAPGILVEDKGYALALHYRLAPEKERTVRESVAAICAELPPASIEVLPGKAVVEIKPVGFTKGTAVRELMKYAPFAGRRPLFIGDDITDEAAFAVMPEFGGVGISVGRLIAGASAHFNAPQDVRRWLDRISHGEGMVAP